MTVTVTVSSVELAVAELIVVVDELSPSTSPQSPLSFGSFASIVVSFPVMPPGRPADAKR